MEFSDNAKKELTVLCEAVKEVLDITLQSFRENNIELAYHVEPLEDLIENSKIVIYDSKVEKYDELEDYSIIGDEVLSFLEQFK